MAARRLIAERLAAAGVIWAQDEAAQLIDAAGGDPARLELLVGRRLGGEPLAWITGQTVFCDLALRVDPGVYVPRPHTEPLARRAAELLPAEGIALDPCTGCGAIAVVMAKARPQAQVIAGDLDERSVACSRRNDATAVHGDLFGGFPAELAGRVDVITAVVPYVPASELPLLHRDTFAFEGRTAYDGGPDGLAVMQRLIRESPRWLRPGGTLLVEIGGGQAGAVTALLGDAGFGDVRTPGPALRALEAKLSEAARGALRRPRASDRTPG